jgi:hypothetical protein
MAETAQRDLVILVHGIRDIARWQSEIRDTLERHGFLVELTNYDRMNLIEFLLPIPFTYFRRIAIDTVWTQIRHAQSLHPRSRVSIIAHSFGTYIIAELLRSEFDIRFFKVIFCGSVVRYNFPLEQFGTRYNDSILNEVGTADPWPAVAESVTTGYGSAGTYGFRRPGVRDRFHNRAGHGYFLRREFCEKFWVPYLNFDRVEKGSERPDPPPVWVRLISTFKIKYVLGLICILFLTPFGVERINQFNSAHASVGSLRDLQLMHNNLSGDYNLVSDIDATETKNWNNKSGFIPIGDKDMAFVGSFKGNGHTINNLYIDGRSEYIGLFGKIGKEGHIVRAVLNGVYVVSTQQLYASVGALAGENDGTVENSFSSGAVSGDQTVGDNIPDNKVGGLIGTNYGYILGSGSTGTVRGGEQGGLVGWNFGIIDYSSSSCQVNGGAGGYQVRGGGYRGSGGLVGDNYGTIKKSFSAGPVTANMGRIGGLTGFNERGNIIDSYSSSSVLDIEGVYIGGLVGENDGAVASSLATGVVNGSGDVTVGGLIGETGEHGTVAASYWDIQSTSQATSAGGKGLTTSELKSALPAGFSGQVWGRNTKKIDYPFLLWEGR